MGKGEKGKGRGVKEYEGYKKSIFNYNVYNLSTNAYIIQLLTSENEVSLSSSFSTEVHTSSEAITI